MLHPPRLHTKRTIFYTTQTDNLTLRQCYTHHDCIRKELSSERKSRCPKCASKYNCTRVTEPLVNWNFSLILLPHLMKICILFLVSFLFVTALFFTMEIYLSDSRIRNLFLVLYLFVSYGWIIVGQSSKFVMFVEYVYCCVTTLEAVHPYIVHF